MKLLAIDPGDVESAWVLYDTDTQRLVRWAKQPNADALFTVAAASVDGVDLLAVEMIASYGMPVGKTVFETCLWIGRFIERWHGVRGDSWQQVYRADVKLHLCHSRRAKDGNVRQALIDRYGPSKEQAIGRKASPGPLYGLSGDGWSALAVAITAAETTALEVAA